MTHIALVDRVAHLEVGGQDSTLDHRLDGVGVGGGDGAVSAVAVDDVPLFGSRLDIWELAAAGFALFFGTSTAAATAAAQTTAMMGFQCFLIKGFTPAGAGWAEAVSRPMRYSGSTLSCGFFFDSMVICPS